MLLADTFNRYFEPWNLAAAERVLAAAGYRLHHPQAAGRPLCCGRTFLAAGRIDEARAEARRTLAALAPLVGRGARVVGLEPSCLLTFRDEVAALLPRDEAAPVAAAAFLLEEVLADDLAAGRASLAFADATGRTAHLHGHCHQKAFGIMPAVEEVLRRVPGLTVRTIGSSCCGMAGAFGHRAETWPVSMAMAELTLLPAVRAAAPGDVVLANGTSCRRQIEDGAGRPALHLAAFLDTALSGARARGVNP